ncbi:C-terminal binding protein [Paenarthrobacter aurescens]|uniref:Dehydrogenase n=1 Tax=Paenarthrobacter aurescens TaxID=43663 RepID=A0A4Y3NGD4_PAEAU|nr:C-terminal binding protein [Paenarthrobacter aurescens]MDO6145436.1 C-terminal binding protein [Paenarthrobacter aurescens]MDO6149241.1 C-terminal binding protein [Paenarthrobacter aurescens]MDO6160485.1 C-terminal binding protein [Paenarthrobacter aurescens]MDO6164344.1 C-terminal binding protein [Paenarthrobacter aurescens]GEB19535.1 dehydrogenase [Paenarthrobacter aurescens]
MQTPVTPIHPSKIVITDCDHHSIDIERAVAREAGVELVLAQCRTEDEVIAAAADADAIVVQYAPITAKVLDALPGLKAIGRYGVGVDTLDVEAATARGVAVCNVPDYGTEDVSDHAIALAVSLARGITQLDRGVRRGDYSLGPVQPLHRIRDRVFGVVGLGLIGAATGRKAKGLGYQVIGSDPLLTTGSVTADGITVVSFEELISRADVISLHVPLNQHTHHLINSDVLDRTKPGAVLVNTCRGAVVDTDAVAAALKDGRLHAAGLDVFEVEPLPRTSPLLELENAVLTPHAAWYSEESYAELKRRTVENVVEVCAGRTPRNILNPDALKKSVWA